MTTATPTPTRDDAERTTPLARRIGPPVVGVSLAVTVALLAWLALAPTAIAGPLSDAPFTVGGTLVVGPDDDGCLRLVDGAAATTTHCLDELAAGTEAWMYVEVAFDAAGDVWVQREDEETMVVLTIDPTTGEVRSRETIDRETGERAFEDRPDVEEPLEVPEPGQPDQDVPQVYTDGDQVRRFGDDGPMPEQGDDPVVLDLEGPPGYRLRDAAMSPDGRWVVATTPDDLVVVAPADGSAAPHVWTEVPDDRWVNLWSAIRWDD